MRNSCQGFSLIETAVVLLIAGLLFAGIIKGQGLIDLNQTKLLADDFRHISLDLVEYQERFKALPGDDPQVALHLGESVSCVEQAGKCSLGNGVIDGHWNDTTADSESFIYWQHIRLARLSPGEIDTASVNYAPQNALGGTLGVTNHDIAPVAGLRGGVVVCSDGITGTQAKQLDIALDDGNTANGFMMTTVSGIATGVAAIPTDLIDDNERYLVCMGV